jgi:hypothetical protein
MRAQVYRRGFLAGAMAVGAASVLARPTESGRLLSAAQVTMIVQVARAGAVFPIDFPSFGEPGPAWLRATPARLDLAIRRASQPRIDQAIRGSRALIEHGLLNQPQARLLDGIGELAERPTPGLTAVVALAVATVSRHFDPARDDAAELWLGCLRHLRQRGWRHEKVI